jgi:hypothetical protein
MPTRARPDLLVQQLAEKFDGEGFLGKVAYLRQKLVGQDRDVRFFQGE